MPGVSVVIPVYNAASHLRECLDTVVAQTYRDMEIICINDGSSDDSGAILGEYASRDERVSVIEQENRGLSRARNRGFEAAAGDYVLFLDSDDWFEPTMIEELHDRCVADDADVSMCRIRYFYANRGVSTDAYWSLQTDLFPDHTPFSHRDVDGNIFLAITPCVWNKMFRRAFLVKHGISFDPGLRRAEDVPFTYVALALADRLTFVDKALVNYRTGVEGTMQDTVHMSPIEICKALSMTKDRITEAGVFDEIERDFVNAALHECLFTLESVKTTASFEELFDVLKSRYFTELGITGREAAYFDSANDYEHYELIMRFTAEEFLVHEGRELRDRLRQIRTELNRALRAERDLSEQVSVANSEVRSLQTMLGDTESRLDKTVGKLEVSREKLERTRSSASYRVGRAITYVPRRISRALASLRKAE